MDVETIPLIPGHLWALKSCNAMNIEFISFQSLVDYEH